MPYLNCRIRVQYAVAYLERATGQPAAPSPVRITNQNCEFDPPVLAAVLGSPLVIRNDDPVLHNVHLFHERRTVANLSLPWRGVELQNRRALSRPGVVEIKCDVHEWMRAQVWVSSHPYFAVTDARGGFRITGVPPGKYTLTVWHEKLGQLSREVVVGASGEVTADFAFSP